MIDPGLSPRSETAAPRRIGVRLLFEIKGFVDERGDLLEALVGAPEIFRLYAEAAARHAERAKRFGRMPSVIDPGVNVPPMTMPEGLVAEVAATTQALAAGAEESRFLSELGV